MKESVLANKSFDFAIRIVNLYKYLTDVKKERCFIKTIVAKWYCTWCITV
jgi:hypothetical protein